MQKAELWIKKGNDFPSLALRCSLPLLAGQLKQNKPFYFSKNTNQLTSPRNAPKKFHVIVVLELAQRISNKSVSLSDLIRQSHFSRHCETSPEVVAIQCLLFHVWDCHASLAVTNIFFIARQSRSNPSSCFALIVWQFFWIWSNHNIWKIII